MSVEVSRYEPDIQYAKNFAQNNFGEIYYVRCGYLRRKGIPGWGFPDEDGFFDVEDLASAVIRFKNDATVILEATWALNRPSEQWINFK